MTALLGSNEYDSGPIIDQEEFYVTYPAKIQEVIELSLISYKNLASKVADKINNQVDIVGFPQDQIKSPTVFGETKMIFISTETNPTEVIKRTIDALGHPYSGAKTHNKKSIITIIDAEVYPDVKVEIRQIGKVIFFRESMPIIVCERAFNDQRVQE